MVLVEQYLSLAVSPPCDLVNSMCVLPRGDGRDGFMLNLQAPERSGVDWMLLPRNVLVCPSRRLKIWGYCGQNSWATVISYEKYEPLSFVAAHQVWKSVPFYRECLILFSTKP